MTYTATYSPDDNKLRLYAGGRLPADVYARVKAAGFKWAPVQELFVAPTWTPDRADLLQELCGEIGDEDTSLAERAEQRADRFEDYSDNRERDADSAHAAVKRIADGIPLGQPILIGHHSEKHARRDAAKIDNGMRKAVKMWETAQYWQDRARGAIRHAKYKERPDVRARRIKGIEADKRKQEKIIGNSEALLKAWRDPAAVLKRKDGAEASLREMVIFLANRDGSYYASEYKRASGYVGPISLWEAAGGNIDDANPEERAIATPQEICATAIRTHTGRIAWARRWLEHFENRLAYERAMLADSGGTVSDRTGPEVGGAVRCWCSPGYGKGWSYIQKVNRVTVTVHDVAAHGGRVFRRTMPLDKLIQIMTRAQVEEARAAGLLVETQEKDGFYLRERPGDETKVESHEEASDRVHREAVAAAQAAREKAAQFDAMKDTLRAGGAQVVTAPQLFPTPPDLAARMVDLAAIPAGARVLEPSAGTGNILRALPGVLPFGDRRQTWCEVVAVERIATLAGRLEPWASVVHCADFLQWGNTAAPSFDRVLMNPPFENADDIKHIQHALTMLKPGGKLVAICANGPRQREKLQPLASEWIDLEPGTFKQSGTGVSTALLVIEAQQ